MKKFSYLLIGYLLIHLLVLSCQDSPLTKTSSVQSFDNYSKRSLSDVIEITNIAISSLDKNSRSIQRNFDINNMLIVVDSNNSRANEIQDTILYIVNFDDEQGFAIIPTRTDLIPLLGISEKGNINNIDEIESPEFKQYITCAINYATNYRPAANAPMPPNRPIITLDEINEIEPARIQVEWGQGYPGNYYCPNQVVGCVPLAVIQALTYIKEPPYMEFSFEGAPISGDSIDWNELRDHVTNIPPPLHGGIHLTEVNNKFALICRQFGQLLGSNYSDSGSTPTRFNSLITTFLWQQRYWYIETSHGYGVPNTQDVLSDGILIMGSSCYENPNDTTILKHHAWIIDGYHNYGTITHLWQINPQTGAYEETQTTQNITYLDHVNWGWNGLYNGLYHNGVYLQPNGDNYSLDCEYVFIHRCDSLYEFNIRDFL